MIEVDVKVKDLRVLDFDIEARPLGWYGGDFVHKEITAIACAWITPKQRSKVHVWALGDTLGTLENEGFVRTTVTEDMLDGFLDFYNRADMVTGHYIRGFDLPNINAAMIEFRRSPLSDKLSQDTKLDLIKISGLSQSQENLGALLGLRRPKIGMDQGKWREANRLTPQGIALTKRRVVGDVRQHIEMRQVLLDQGLLGRPKVWKSAGTGQGSYHS